jgi:hypothetical protein
MWQFMAVAEGYAKAHEVEDPNKTSQAELDDVWEWMQTKH